MRMVSEFPCQLDAAEEAMVGTIKLLPGEYLTSSRQILHRSYTSPQGRGVIASAFDFHSNTFRIHHNHMVHSLNTNEFDGAHFYIQQAKAHTLDDAYFLSLATSLQARIWLRQLSLEKDIFESMRALWIFRDAGALEEESRTFIIACSNVRPNTLVSTPPPGPNHTTECVFLSRA